VKHLLTAHLTEKRTHLLALYRDAHFSLRQVSQGQDHHSPLTFSQNRNQGRNSLTDADRLRNVSSIAGYFDAEELSRCLGSESALPLQARLKLLTSALDAHSLKILMRSSSFSLLKDLLGRYPLSSRTGEDLASDIPGLWAGLCAVLSLSLSHEGGLAVCGKREPSGEFAIVSLVNSVKQQLKQQQQLLAVSPNLSDLEKVLSQKQEEVERWSLTLHSLSITDETFAVQNEEAPHALRNRLFNLLRSIRSQRAVLSAMMETAQGLCRCAGSSPTKILETLVAQGLVLTDEGTEDLTAEVDLKYLISLLAAEVNSWLCSTLLHLCGVTHGGEDTSRITELDEVFTIGTDTSHALLQLAVRSTLNSNMRYR
jgi:hypothetical protein